MFALHAQRHGYIKLQDLPRVSGCGPRSRQLVYFKSEQRGCLQNFYKKLWPRQIWFFLLIVCGKYEPNLVFTPHRAPDSGLHVALSNVMQTKVAGYHWCSVVPLGHLLFVKTLFRTRICLLATTNVLECFFVILVNKSACLACVFILLFTDAYSCWNCYNTKAK